MSNLQVAAGPFTSRVEKPRHPITIRELMTHTAGFSYGLFSDSRVDRMYLEKQVLAYDGTLNMIQQCGADRPDVRSLTRRLTYQAIAKPGRQSTVN